MTCILLINTSSGMIVPLMISVPDFDVFSFSITKAKEIENNKAYAKRVLAFQPDHTSIFGGTFYPCGVIGRRYDKYFRNTTAAPEAFVLLNFPMYQQTKV